MKIRLLLKKNLLRSKLFLLLYNEFYIKFLEWKRFNVNVIDSGKDNIVEIPKRTFCTDLRITFLGNNNRIKIGNSCLFKETNMIYVQGDGNMIEIGDDTIFDKNVSIVLAEGTRCCIGSGCRFANGVRIRTSDQHFIYDEYGKRINHAKDVHIGEHVWLGASVIVMKGATIGDGSVIGMDSMVTKNIPSQSLAVGKPAKVIKSNIYWEE